MLSEAFKTAVWQYRASGERLYKLALDHGMPPATLSASMSGARRVDHDPRLIAIGKTLGLKAEEVFDENEVFAP